MAELTTALSLATDVGLSEPFEHGQRSALLAAWLATLAALPTDEAQAAFYLAMLKTVGCAGDDDVGFRVLGEDLGEWVGPIGGAGKLEAMGLVLRNVGSDLPAPRPGGPRAGGAGRDASGDGGVAQPLRGRSKPGAAAGPGPRNRARAGTGLRALGRRRAASSPRG